MSIFYKGLAAKRTFIEFIKMNRLDLLHTKCFVISSFQTFFSLHCHKTFKCNAYIYTFHPKKLLQENALIKVKFSIHKMFDNAILLIYLFFYDMLKNCKTLFGF